MQQLVWHGGLCGSYVTGAMRQLFHGGYASSADGSYVISEGTFSKHGGGFIRAIVSSHYAH